MEKISVIVPVYNGEKYLKRCIESLLNQTYKNNEYIFVNDGSTDNTLKILREYKDDRVIILDKKNTGVSDSRNKAIEMATGEYICFCDADDFYEKDYIEKMHSLIKKQNVDVVRCNYKVIDSGGKEIDAGINSFTDKVLENEDVVKDIIPLCLNGSMPCFTYLLMIKKECLKTNFPTDIAMMEDVVFYIKLLLETKKIYITNEKLYTIMFNESGATNNTKNYKRNINNIVLVNKYIKNILKDSNLFNESNIQNLNINNLRAISDFVFRYYLAGNNAISLCKDISSLELDKLIETTDISKLDLSRRLLLKLLYGKKYKTLKLYFILRKIVYKAKRRK